MTTWMRIADSWPTGPWRRASPTTINWPGSQVQIFESVDLPDHWPRLDDFEGPEYQRVVTTVKTALGDIDASLYVSMAP